MKREESRTERKLASKLSKLISRRSKKNRERFPSLACYSFDYISNKITIDGLYERDELILLANWIKSRHPDKLSLTAIDVGANIGNHSLFFAKHFEKVFSFEPNPRVFRLLQINAEMTSNISAFPFAVSDKAGKATLKIIDGNYGGSHLTEGKMSESDNFIDVNMMCLDQMASDFGDVGLIKLDVENHELQALKGAVNLLKVQKPIVLFEQCSEAIKNGKSEVVDYLRTLGYDNFYSIRKQVNFKDLLCCRSIGEFRLSITSFLSGDKISLIRTEIFRQKSYGILVAESSL